IGTAPDALRRVVPVQVGPRQRRAAVEIGIVGLREAGAVGADVLADPELDGSLAVALYVPRETQSRRDVVPVRHVGLRVELSRRHETTGLDAACADRPVEVLETHAGIDGEAAKRPGILGVD